MQSHKENNFEGRHTELLSRTAKWCAAQDRSVHEVRTRLQQSGLDHSDIDLILQKLKAQNFLDDERFAKSYAGGHFRLKLWGKEKIRNGLEKHGLHASTITNALSAISEEEYRDVLKKLATKKIAELKSQSAAGKYRKVAVYLAAKGFEEGRVSEVLDEQLGQIIDYDFRT